MNIALPGVTNTNTSKLSHGQQGNSRTNSKIDGIGQTKLFDEFPVSPSAVVSLTHPAIRGLKMAVCETMREDHYENKAKEVMGDDTRAKSLVHGEILTQQLSVKDAALTVVESRSELSSHIYQEQCSQGIVPKEVKLEGEECQGEETPDSSDVAACNGPADIIEKSVIPSSHTPGNSPTSNSAADCSVTSPALYGLLGTHDEAKFAIEIKGAVASPKVFGSKSPNRVTGKEVVSVDGVTEIDDAGLRTYDEQESFDIKGREPQEDTKSEVKIPKQAALEGLQTKAKERKMIKKAKSSDRMKKVNATQKSPGSSPPVTPKKPLMDLRHILKKHEKKSEAQQMHQSEGHVDFYGSMSSIPFLKGNMPEKKKSKGKRPSKENRSKKTDIEEQTNPDDGKERKKISIVTENRDGQKRTTEVTVTLDYDDDDLSMWKSMSALDGSFMEEVSDRPRDMLPLVPIPSPKKEDEKPPPQHNHRGFHRPDDWVEFGHPKKRSPVKLTYRPKLVCDAVVVDAPSVFNDAEGKQTGKDKKEERLAQRQMSQIDDTVCQQEVQSPTAQTTPNSPKLRSPSEVQSEPTKETRQKGVPASPSKKKSPAKSEKLKVNRVTELAIQFHDGCVVNGHFRPKESVQRVIQDLTRDVLRSDMPLPSFDLCVKSPDDATKKLDPMMTLEELNLVPSGKVYVTWTKPIAITMTPGWYLLDEDEVPHAN